MTERFISGEFENIFRVNFHKFFIGLTIVGKHAWQQEEERNGEISTVRMLQGHSGRNLIDPSLQDNVVIQSEFFHHDARLIFILSSTMD